MAATRPTGLIAKQGIELLTWGTPNGHKVSILLEELKDAYGLQYTTQAIDIGSGVQKEPWFTAVCPNGRIPAIVDHDNNGLCVFEGIAILGYLTRRYDRDHLFSFAPDDDDYTRCETWMGWQHGGLGPMQGQANHFIRAAKEKIPYAIQRYVGETERLYGVLDAHLASHQYVVGDRFSIADMALLGWVNAAAYCTVDDAVRSRFTHILAWFRRCWARPAVRRGFAVPSPPRSNLIDGQDSEAKQKTDELRKMVDEAKEKYGYVYKSP